MDTQSGAYEVDCGKCGARRGDPCQETIRYPDDQGVAWRTFSYTTAHACGARVNEAARQAAIIRR